MPLAPIRQGPEAAAAAIVGTLKAFLPGDIDNVWTAWSGSGADPTDTNVPLKVYPKHYYKFKRDLVSAADYPAIFVSPGPGSRQLANHMTTPNVPGAAYDIEQHRVYVEVGAMGPTHYELEAVVTRYVWAIRTCLLKHPLLDGDATNLLGGYTGEMDLGVLGVGRATDVSHPVGKMLQLWGGVEAILTVEEAIY